MCAHAGKCTLLAPAKDAVEAGNTTLSQWLKKQVNRLRRALLSLAANA
jgi:hypothetical protein